MRSRIPAAFLLALAAALLAATRIPGDSPWPAVAAATSIGLLALAPLLLLRKPRRWVGLAALALLAGGLLVPTSRTAALAGLPDAAVAFVAAAALLYAQRHDATKAPQAVPRSQARLRQALRFLPPAMLAALVLLLPWLLQVLLPARIAAAYELDTAAGPAVALLLLAVPVLALVALSRLLRGNAVTAKAGEPSPDAEAKP